MLDLDAPIHDDGETAGLGDPSAFLVDHGVLTPRFFAPMATASSAIAGQRLRRAKHVDDVYWNGHVSEGLKLRSPRISASRGFTGMTR